MKQKTILPRQECSFTFFSAALHNYLPAYPYSLHEKTFANWLLNSYLSRLEQNAMSVLNLTVIKNEPPSGDFPPSVICTFHMGSYRLINLWLIRSKIPFALVIGQSAIKREATELQQIFGGHQVEDTGSLELINAEVPGSIFKMIHTLKAGISLLFYIDGNTGTGAVNQENTNCCLINFLQQKIWARKGMAYLAHLAKVPILPVVSYRTDWLSIILKFGTFIWPDQRISRDTFAITTTQQVFNFAAPYIQQYPEQWKGWMNIHEIAQISPRDSKGRTTFRGQKVCFNNRYFGLFRLNNKAYLLQKNSYEIFALTGTLYKSLMLAKNKPVSGQLFSQSHLQELGTAEVLQDA